MIESLTITGAVKLKIERAQHHIDELEQEIATFLKESPSQLAIRTDHKVGKKTLFIKTNRPVPHSFSLLLGDAVHNLRSALDIFTFNLIAPICEQPDEVFFPISLKSREAFHATLKSGQIRFAHKKVRQAFKAIEAYPGANDFLCGLHRLSITDKHKLILTTARMVTLTIDELAALDPAFAKDEEPGAIDFLGTDTLVEISYVYHSRRDRRAARNEPITELKAAIQPPFQICFGQDEPFEGQNVVLTLRHVCNEALRAMLQIFDAVQEASPPEQADA